ncbi:PH domain-containing protein [Candidatus Gracilibacteria bacterium]|nr:PH domain-containing protein [Candidatus Gracilibacteria bacterium]
MSSLSIGMFVLLLLAITVLFVVFVKYTSKDEVEELGLRPEETVVCTRRRHWIVLLARLIVPGGILGVFGILAFYRGLGGTFFAAGVDASAAGSLDIVGWLLVFTVFALLAAWFAMFNNINSKKKRDAASQVAANSLIGLAVLCLFLIYFRAQGGRIFYFDPYLAGSQSYDLLNLIFIILCLLGFLFLLFTIYDWYNDEIVVTNQRVIYDNDQVFIPRLIERRVQEQIRIEDVQDVVAKTESYTQHYLKFGTIRVKSARIGGDIVFDAANMPLEMKAEIMKVVNARRKSRSAEDLRRLVDVKIYDHQNGGAPTAPEVRKETGSMLFAFVRWFAPENPERNGNTFIWRKHWLFSAIAVFWPLVWLFIMLTILAIAAANGWIGGGVALVAMLAISLVLLAWLVYRVEDYRNDKYILTDKNVQDIEAKPFGPEDQRSASLGALQNITAQTTFVSNLLGYGDVFLETAGSGGKFTFHNVPDPQFVVNTVNDYIVQFKQGERDKAFNDVLDVLKLYHKDQQQGQSGPATA